MPNTTILPQNLPDEADDFPKKFKNIDTEDFEFTWDNKVYIVKPDEIRTFPKYLVNYAAMHLARKIQKREAIKNFVGTEREKQVAAVKIVDAEKEMALQTEMVACNFDAVQENKIAMNDDKSTPIPAISNSDKPQEDNKLVCDVCGFKAKSDFGLSVHKRKHPKQ